MTGKHNFSSVQCSLAPEVTARLKSELYSFDNTGLSPLSVATGSPEYRRLASSAEEKLRALLSVPQSHQVFFFGGTAETMYAAIPQNLLSEHLCADYLVTGIHSKNAYLEAKRYGDIAIAASSAGAIPIFSFIPETKRSDFRPDADYVYICYNNSHYGTRFRQIPDTGNIPLVVDMSSSFLSEPVDVSKAALLFADLGCSLIPAGMTVLIARRDLLREARPYTPTHLNFRAVADGEARHSAPSGFCMYTAERTFSWLCDIGGLDEMKRRCERKASMIYDYLDSQTYYTAPACKRDRSVTDVVFMTGNAMLDERFLGMATDTGLLHLAGTAAVGGMCAAIGPTVPSESVEELIAFMKRFAFENPKISF